MVTIVAEYTQKVENSFQLPETYGWEHWLDRRRKERKKDPLVATTAIFWAALALANAGFAALFVLGGYAR